jgi:hypothetical protein
MLYLHAAPVDSLCTDPQSLKEFATMMYTAAGETVMDGDQPLLFANGSVVRGLRRWRAPLMIRNFNSSISKLHIWILSIQHEVSFSM